MPLSSGGRIDVRLERRAGLRGLPGAIELIDQRELGAADIANDLTGARADELGFVRADTSASAVDVVDRLLGGRLSLGSTVVG